MYTNDEAALRGLPLAEVLLEECQSQAHPAIDRNQLQRIKNACLAPQDQNSPEPPAAQIARQTGETPVPPAGESLQAADQEAGQQLIQDPSVPAEEREATTVKEVYRWMRDDLGATAVEAEKTRWRDHFKLRYLEKFKYLTEDESAFNNILDHAVIAHLSGLRHSLENKYQQEYATIKDKERRQQMVETAVLKAIDDWAKGQGDEELKAAPRFTVAAATGLARSTQRSALCLSGGGIRSATFNLGILQGLARHGLLEKFDYLSTVSGGGFIGGWLTAWIHREGLDSVVDQLSAPPNSPLKPEPGPIEHLRVYSNYLSPQTGLLSADTWALVASVLRNLMLNWLVFVPVLVSLLLLPRLWASLLFHSSGHEYALPISLIVGVVAALWSFAYIGRHLPSANSDETKGHTDKYEAPQGPFVMSCLLPMTISAIAFAVFFWLRLRSGQGALPYESVAFWVVVVVPWLFCIIKIWRNSKERKWLIARLIGATVLIGLAEVITFYLLQLMTSSFVPVPNTTLELLYASFSVPLLLVVLCLGGSLIAGFTSRLSKDDDQEWWARAGAWVLIVAVFWSLIHVLVLYGPLMIIALVTVYQNVKQVGIGKLPWRDLATMAGTALGVVSGIITLVGGFGAKTPANAKEAQQASGASLALSAVTTLVAPIFMAFVFIVIALGTNFLLVSSIGLRINSWLTGHVLQSHSSSLHDWHLQLLKATPFRYVAAVAISQMLLALVMGRLINTNNFSLQYLWRNRIIRAYLGASNTDNPRPDPFTGFDTYDNLLMQELRIQPGQNAPYVREGRYDPKQSPARVPPPLSKKLFHVLNIALNLTGGKKLQWQDRRAESFTVSPLHAGSYWLGYRRSGCYGGEEGISLGAAIAISGAFVSPNMGYMMSSPVIRFLMALFNVRFGFWLGNPGPAGDERDIFDRTLDWLLKPLETAPVRPFQLGSPRFSVKPIVAEAFGSIDDKSSYVYLSDGGHFENLGLYEMVLRRCRFIVVCDASTDPEYSFQSLAMSVRQIRVDLGVPIEIADMSVNSPSQELRGKYCAIGTIRYSCVDRDPVKDAGREDAEFDGTLIYIKPSLIGAEPRDVVNYWQDSSGFPQEVITDQWFSEAQFESYRALGSHIIDAICDPSGERSHNKVNFHTFKQKVEDHNRLDFRAFREKVGYAALEKAALAAVVPPAYTQRVAEFIKSVLGR